MNLTLGIRTKDLHSIARSRRPVVVPIKCPRPQTMAPTPPKLKVLEPPTLSLLGYDVKVKVLCNLRLLLLCINVDWAIGYGTTALFYEIKRL